MTSAECPLCGGKLQLVREPRPFRIGQRTATVEYEFFRCGTCGEELLNEQQIDAVQYRAVDAIRDQDQLLRPAEIRAIRQQLGYTQVQLEQLLGTGPKTVARWEGGTVCQSAVADRALRFFAAYPHLVPFFRGAAELAGTTSQVHAPSSVVTVSANITITESVSIVASPEPGQPDQMLLDLTPPPPVVNAANSELALAA